MINVKLGDCVEELKKLEANSIDSLVTDPPAGISFMGKKWDDDKGGPADLILSHSDACNKPCEGCDDGCGILCKRAGCAADCPAAALDEQSGANNSRFFYCPKASKSDKGADNVHPTVKSTTLMSYLIELVTHPGGIVLDPFMGSGSTGVAAKREGFGFVGIEQDPEYFGIATKRLGDNA